MNFVYLVGILTGVGGFNFGYDIGVISGVLTVPLFQQLMGMTPETKAGLEGNIASALQLGAFPGIVIQSFLNDRFGRKNTILFSCIVFLLGGLLQAFANGLNLMYLGRLTSGFGVGIMMISVNMFNSEIAPKEIRGRVVGIQQLMVGAGIATAYWTNYLMNVVADGSETAFRLPLGLQVVPSILLWIGMLFVPKSPRWLASKGRFDEARSSLARIREVPDDDTEVERELGEIRRFLEFHDTSTWSETVAWKNRQRLGVGITLLVFQQFTGQNIINYFAPSIFKNIGIEGNKTSLFATGVVGLLKMFMTLPALYTVDRVGRRPLLLIGTATMACAFYYIGGFETVRGDSNGGGFRYIAIAAIYIFTAGYSISWGVMHYVVPAEIYPTNIRAKAETVSGIIEGFFQIVSIKTAPLIIKALPGGQLFFLFAGMLSLFMFWIFFIVPETKGVALENMEEVFESWPRWKPIQLSQHQEIVVDENYVESAVGSQGRTK